MNADLLIVLMFASMLYAFTWQKRDSINMYTCYRCLKVQEKPVKRQIKKGWLTPIRQCDCGCTTFFSLVTRL